MDFPEIRCLLGPNGSESGSYQAPPRPLPSATGHDSCSPAWGLTYFLKNIAPERRQNRLVISEETSNRRLSLFHERTQDMKCVTMTCLILALAGSLAPAVEPLGPPPHGKTKLQKDWLRAHLAGDIQAIDAFPRSACGDMRKKLTFATRDETDLLADYYQLSREIADREMRQIVQAQIPQPPAAQAQGAQAQGAPPPAVRRPAAAAEDDEQAKTDRQELRKLSKKVAAARKPVRAVGEYIYASLPGWCAQQEARFVPDSYYGDDQYVGPLDSPASAGPNAESACRAWSEWRGFPVAPRRTTRTPEGHQASQPVWREPPRTWGDESDDPWGRARGHRGYRR
jgi:hypothetical protein